MVDPLGTVGSVTDHPQALHLASGDQVIEVPSWVALYAVRYALGRQTYAHHDALHLVRRHWPALRRWRRQIVDDVQAVVDANPGSYEASTAQLLLEWIEEQETG